MFARIRKSKTIKLIMAFAAINLLVEIAFPTVAMALTAGSASPEFSSFEPVATTDMVNDFTGDFTYNLPVLSVPGPDGGGYSMSLSYHSGVSSEEEASWVGFGWTLNPGAINRQKRGYADDFKDVSVTKYNKTTPNWTQVSAFDFNMEYNSADNPKDTSSAVTNRAKKLFLDKKGDNDPNAFGSGEVGVSFSKSIRYNNYSGFNIVNGFGVSSKGMVSLNMNRSAGETTLGFSVNPVRIFQKIFKNNQEDNKVESEQNEPEKKKEKTLAGKIAQKIVSDITQDAKNKFIATSYSSWSFNAPAIGYSVAQNSGKATNFSASLQINPAGPIGFQAGIKGSMNYQITEPDVDIRVYGYMYNPSQNPKELEDDGTNNVSDKERVESDFQIEKPSTFNKHDRNLGIPFNNADIFAATGNGVIGGFKLYHDQVGHYYAPFVENNQKISQLGVEVGIGGTISVGFDFGLGFQETKVSDWRDVEEDFDYNNTAPYLRFNGDMGGQIDYSGDNQPLTAIVGGSYMNRKLDLVNFKDGNAGEKAKLDNTKAGRTSFIEYIKGVPSSSEENLIVGMVVTNKDGNKSTYGEPVYVYKETELTIGLENDITIENTTLKSILNDGDATPAQYVVNHPLQFNNPTLNKTAVGQRVESPYVSTYLLTSNTTFDYLDISGDGPSEDDFGGWTKFDYRQVHNDYRYRAPYTGLFYDRGRLFDGDDQTGSMSSGVKDVKYLKSVETKTHIAFFVTNKTQTSDFDAAYSSLDLTGSMNDRFDGLDAAAIPTGTNADDPAAIGTKGGKQLEKLERIALYAKNDLSKPISTTYFEYDYALVQGIPNTDGLGNQKGKLTLKKVWTESGGTIKSRIAPYQFEYEYFTDYSDEITTKYPYILDNNEDLNDAEGAFYASLTEPGQNPSYQEGQLDMWGNYRFDGEDRFEKMQPWVNQKEQNPQGNDVIFDPAAWQLKRIILPSGGEIHVQYEQKDYRFVQDQKAMVMTSLTDHNDFKNSYDTEGIMKNKYFINLESLGFDPLDPDYSQQVTNYVNTLTEHFVTLKNKLYYKILYSYRANYIPNLDNFNHRYDYITGYTSVNEVVKDGAYVYLSLGNEGEEDKTIPRWVGFQKLHQQADRNLGWDAHNVEIDDREILNKAYQTSGAITSNINKIGRDYTLSNTFNLFGNWVAGDVKNYPKDKACKILNFDLSYFKLPAYHAKKGGGVRVKRLLSYDPGIAGETGDAMVYGSEYTYKNSDGTSSGVATNEPQQGREESPLTTIVERNKQSGWNKMLNGRDSKEQEGPLGESLLPGASVVHERVIIKNIHSGKTTTGYAVNKYHTTRSFPMQVDFTEISKDGDSPTYKKYNLNLPLGLFNMSINRAWVTQGYLFKLNDMHGKPESQATYSGTYNPNSFNEAAYTSKTTYQYTKPGTAIKSLIYDSGTQDFTIGLMQPGQEEDLTMYRSKVTDRTNDFSIELDLNITLPTPITLGFGLSYTYSDDQLSQHVTSKVIRQKSYLLSTTTTTDGVTQTTENLAFDKYTGDPVLTKTYDGYYAVDEQINTEGGTTAKHNGEYYALNIPASWVYAEMGRKSDLVTHSNQLTASVGNIVTYGENALVDPSTGKAKSTSANPISGIFTNVVNASATVYKKGWFDVNDPENINQTALEAEYPLLTSYNSTGSVLNNNYYPHRTYVYRDQVTDANNGARIYGGGVITDPLNMFDWLSGDFSQKELGKWYSASEIISYSPHGYPIQETDVLNISSTAHFGYNNTLPVLVAQNAAYSEVKFIDFEYGFNNNSNINNNYAHSGAKSYDLSLDKNYVFIQNYPITPQIIATNGLSIKLWLKSSLSNVLSSPNYGLKNSIPDLKALIGGQQFNFKRIAQTGEWSLYVVEIRNFNGLVAGTYNIQLGYNYLPNEMVLVDDFRIQPLDALMNCTVYTIDNKVAAQFDDQHFGVYYEYNNKGQLVRKSIETERGKKTLQEQQYNTPLILRTN